MTHSCCLRSEAKRWGLFYQTYVVIFQALMPAINRAKNERRLHGLVRLLSHRSLGSLKCLDIATFPLDSTANKYDSPSIPTATTYTASGRLSSVLLPWGIVTCVMTWTDISACVKATPCPANSSITMRRAAFSSIRVGRCLPRRRFSPRAISSHASPLFLTRSPRK